MALGVSRDGDGLDANGAGTEGDGVGIDFSCERRTFTSTSTPASLSPLHTHSYFPIPLYASNHHSKPASPKPTSAQPLQPPSPPHSHLPSTKTRINQPLSKPPEKASSNPSSPILSTHKNKDQQHQPTLKLLQKAISHQNPILPEIQYTQT